MQQHALRREVGQPPLADSALRRKVVEFSRLLEKLPAGAYMCDPTGLITYYNQRAVELWGRAPRLNDPEDRFCGSFKLFAPDGAPIHHDQCWMALALYMKTEYNGHEIVIERPDGSRLTVLAHANPIWDESETLLGAVNVLVDITDRKQAEEVQRQLQAKLAHMGRLSLAGEMAAGLAHEINQPLAAIVAYSEACIGMLRSGAADTDKLVGAMEQLVEQAQRAGDIIRRLRGFTRKTGFQRIRVNVNELVREGMGFIVAEAREREVSLRLELADALPSVEVDPVQIQQVLVNLIRNSLEAMSDGEPGRRRLTVRTEMAAGDVVAVTVCDTGPGVAAEIRDHLFHPFVTTKPQGMGLGLSISKSIVEAHEGRLATTAESRYGATFQFTLPAVVADFPLALAKGRQKQ